jgi:hypothetical protein
MKYLIMIFTLILTLVSNLISQNYFPFPEDNVNWNVYFLSGCDDDIQPTTYLIRYTIHGDTSINEIIYNKLCVESGDILNPKIISIGGIRELDKKIYFYGQNPLGLSPDGEVLLYDFTRQVGDTIKHDSEGLYYSVIEEIDSLLIDGDYRKRFKVNISGLFQNPDYIVEGIGSIKNGLLGHITTVPTCGYHYWEHICFRVAGIVKYLNPSFIDCFSTNQITSTEQLSCEQNIGLFPNPTRNELKVKNNINEKTLVVKIFDANGKLVKHVLLTDKEGIIEMSVAPGFFNILITNTKGKILKTEKIIVN